MKITIVYYSGTGNSLWTAKKIGADFDKSEILPMTASVNELNSDIIGLVFPVHMWGLPRRVIEFVNRVKFSQSAHIFALAVNAGQVSRTLVQLKNLLKKKGLFLSLGHDIVLPSNYIPWGGPGPDIEEKIATATQKIEKISRTIKEKGVAPVEKGPRWQRIIFTLLYKLSFKQVPQMDKKFFVDEKCTGCGTCEKVCITQNITMESNKPVWHQNCEQCLACIQWCPAEAIQYGPKTFQYQRYHHPEIKLAEFKY